MDSGEKTKIESVDGAATMKYVEGDNAFDAVWTSLA
jgi:hypothetical protein